MSLLRRSKCPIVGEGHFHYRTGVFSVKKVGQGWGKETSPPAPLRSGEGCLSIYNVKEIRIYRMPYSETGKEKTLVNRLKSLIRHPSPFRRGVGGEVPSPILCLQKVN
jgi:hypothetical protein